MTDVDLTQFKPGDRVRAQFAPPAAGWIEAEVLEEPLGDAVFLAMHAGRESFYGGDFVSVTKVEPPIQAGDAVWIEGKVWLVPAGEMDTYNYLEDDSRMGVRIKDIPADAIWLVRGGRLNPLLTGGE
jgi:hypothetical protein